MHILKVSGSLKDTVQNTVKIPILVYSIYIYVTVEIKIEEDWKLS